MESILLVTESEVRKEQLIFSRHARFFVRAGCFFGTKERFIEKLAERHGGTKHKLNYLKALELAELVLDDWKCGEE